MTQDDSTAKGRLVCPAEVESCVTGRGASGQPSHGCRALIGWGEKENYRLKWLYSSLRSIMAGD